MTYVVTDKCRNHRYTDCVDVCPVEAFHILPDILVINPETCIDCGACIPECPVDAIYELDEVPEDQKHYIAFNAEESLKYPVITEKIDPLAKQE